MKRPFESRRYISKKKRSVCISLFEFPRVQHGDAEFFKFKRFSFYIQFTPAIRDYYFINLTLDLTVKQIERTYC